MRRSWPAPVGSRAAAALLLGVGSGLYVFLAGTVAQARSAEDASPVAVAVEGDPSLEPYAPPGVTRPREASGTRAATPRAGSPPPTWRFEPRDVSSGRLPAPDAPSVRRLPTGFVPNRNTAPPPVS
ncbi:MAG: hypothetical protein AMXMBFR53_29200 [Gemmatimonadota bacterium]